MSISYDILGEPGRDNALLVTVASGQSQHRLLFDCGEGCLSRISISHIQAIEAVFFSHFHIDHIAGFDTFLRMNWARPDTPVRIFGPPGAVEVVHHRLRGYTPGDSIAYVTDFFLATEADEDRLVGFLSGCQTIVCENNYRDADADLARKNYHMTSSDVARLASRVEPDKLVLFHVSDRYDGPTWREQLAEVRERFERAAFPQEWLCSAPRGLSPRGRQPTGRRPIARWLSRSATEPEGRASPWLRRPRGLFAGLLSWCLHPRGRACRLCRLGARRSLANSELRGRAS
jgi:ribonuclease BN (tRNA processing enzyme)